MYKKDYQLIADVFGIELGKLQREYDDAKTSINILRRMEEVSNLAKSMADELKKDNPKFRYDKFFAACGLDSFGNLGG